MNNQQPLAPTPDFTNNQPPTDYPISSALNWEADHQPISQSPTPTSVAPKPFPPEVPASIPPLAGSRPEAGTMPAGNTNQPAGHQPEDHPVAGISPDGNDPLPAGEPEQQTPSSVGSLDDSQKPPDISPSEPIITTDKPVEEELPDDAFDIPIDQMVLQLGKAKVVREERTIRGYCESGNNIHCRLKRADDTKQIKYHSYQSSIDGLIAHLKDIDAKRRPVQPARPAGSQPEAGTMPAGNTNQPAGHQPEDQPVAGISPDGNDPLPAGEPEIKHTQETVIDKEASEQIDQLKSELFDAQILAEARKQTLAEMTKFYDQQATESRVHHTQEIKHLTERAVAAETQLERLQPTLQSLD